MLNLTNLGSIDQNMSDILMIPRPWIVPFLTGGVGYYSASIPFAASIVAFRTLNGKPFILVYEVSATLEKPEAIVKLQTALNTIE